MHMSVFHIFMAILAILSISIVISIVNWILQIRISSRIMALEKELRKKTLEFDTLKKERAAPQIHTHQPPQVDLSTQLEIPIESPLVDDGEIRIMRNVRGTFSPALEEATPDRYTEDPVEATQVEASRSIPHGRQTAAPFSPQGEFPDDTKRWQQNATTGTRLPNRQAAPAAVHPTKPIAPPAEDRTIVLPLFSPAAGGADFNGLYNQLIEALKIPSNQNIAFDCGGIQFLVDQEIEYFEKMCHSLVSQNRSLQILNCGSELRSLLQQNGRLASLIR
jgi:hypothetical protein